MVNSIGVCKIAISVILVQLRNSYLAAPGMSLFRFRVWAWSLVLHSSSTGRRATAISYNPKGGYFGPCSLLEIYSTNWLKWLILSRLEVPDEPKMEFTRKPAHAFLGRRKALQILRKRGVMVALRRALALEWKKKILVQKNEFESIFWYWLLASFRPNFWSSSWWRPGTCK